MSIRFRTSGREEPEINLIPFIDILLVVLIFLMLTTTYSKYTELQVNLPLADAEAARTQPKEIIVTVSKEGRYAVGRTILPATDVPTLVQALQTQADGQKEAVVVVINADSAASHQSVINVMEAARRSGLNQITFATQQPRGR
jgi:biopolymer transport protein ExbD